MQDRPPLWKECPLLAMLITCMLLERRALFSTPRQDTSPPYAISREFVAIIAVSDSGRPSLNHPLLPLPRPTIPIFVPNDQEPTTMGPVVDGHWLVRPAGRSLQDSPQTVTASAKMIRFGCFHKDIKDEEKERARHEARRHPYTRRYAPSPQPR
jgi:hypothetical protein